MAATPQLMQAPPEYNQASEALFRRELENILVIAMAIAENVATGTAPLASHTSKRHQYLPAVAIVTRSAGATTYG